MSQHSNAVQEDTDLHMMGRSGLQCVNTGKEKRNTVREILHPFPLWWDTTYTWDIFYFCLYIYCLLPKQNSSLFGSRSAIVFQPLLSREREREMKWRERGIEAPARKSLNPSVTPWMIRKPHSVRGNGKKVRKEAVIMFSILLFFILAFAATLMAIYKQYNLVIKHASLFRLRKHHWITPPIEDWLVRYHDQSKQTQKTQRSDSGRPGARRSKRKQFAVFYNAYISEDDPSVAYEVIQEQIDKIAESYLASPHIATTIYYATLGQALPDGFMERLCTERNGLTCQHLKHYDDGYEEVTLASLYDYCQYYPNDRVMYFHSKGENISVRSVSKDGGFCFCFCLSNPSAHACSY